jgi:hypothetical protein
MAAQASSRLFAVSKVRNAGPAVIAELRLWIEDFQGEPVSTGAGGPMVLPPNDPAVFLEVNVINPERLGKRLMVGWTDADDEHTEFTGIQPP